MTSGPYIKNGKAYDGNGWAMANITEVMALIVLSFIAGLMLGGLIN